MDVPRYACPCTAQTEENASLFNFDSTKTGHVNQLLTSDLQNISRSLQRTLYEEIFKVYLIG